MKELFNQIKAKNSEIEITSFVGIEVNEEKKDQILKSLIFCSKNSETFFEQEAEDSDEGFSN